VERVDHGIHSLQDQQLVEYMVEHQLPVTLCPLSNLHLKVSPCIDYATSAHRPLKEFEKLLQWSQ
jgi:adenosine deaminase